MEFVPNHRAAQLTLGDYPNGMGGDFGCSLDGSTPVRDLDGNAVDLTGYSFRLSFHERDTGTIAFSCSTESGEIVVFRDVFALNNVKHGLPAGEYAINLHMQKNGEPWLLVAQGNARIGGE